MNELYKAFENIAATSGVPNGKTETEIIIYCKITDFDGLQKASHIEQHEQLETEFKNGTRCRVRKTVIGEVQKLEFTYKLKSGVSEGFEANVEHTCEIDSAFYEGFRNIAEKRLLKTRYVFESDKIVLTYNDESDQKHELEVPGIKYEVDVYVDQDNQVCEWCKIDVEVDPILDYVNEHHRDLENVKLNVRISHLPFIPIDAILTQSADEEQKQFISNLWTNHFNLPTKDA